MWFSNTNKLEDKKKTLFLLVNLLLISYTCVDKRSRLFFFLSFSHPLLDIVKQSNLDDVVKRQFNFVS